MAETIQSDVATSTSPNAASPESGAGSVTKESYQGPSVAVTKLGNVTYAHLTVASAATGIGMAIGLLFPGRVNGAVKMLQEAGMEWSKSEAFLTRRTGRFMQWLFGYSDGVYARIANNPSIMQHIPEEVLGARGKMVRAKKNIIEMLKSKDAGFIPNFARGFADILHDLGEAVGLAKPRSLEEVMSTELTRTDAFLATGGLFGGVTWIGAWIWGLFSGGTGNKGKDQFERAQKEVGELNNKYAAAQVELEQLKSGRQANTAVPQTPAAPVSTPGENPEEHTKKRDDQKPPALIASASRESVLGAVPLKAIN